MNRIAVNGWCVVVLLTVSTGLAGVSPQSIDGPNGYGFVSDTYYAEATDAKATISVQWSSGNRDYCCGNVGFATSAGTAVAGQDYDEVSGTLAFSGPYWKTFDVPLHALPSPTDKFIRLALKQYDSNSYFWPRSEALLVIRATPPRLDFIRTNSTLRLFWPDTYTNYVVEMTTGTEINSGKWSAVATAPSQANGHCVVDFVLDGQSRFFRLRKR